MAALIGINDSRLGSISRDETDGEYRMTVGGLARLSVPITHPRSTVRVGSDEVELSRRRSLLLPHTYVVQCRLGDVDYRLVPRGVRLAEVTRERRTVAVLARPRRGERIIRWDERHAPPADHEIVIGHALAVYAGY